MRNANANIERLDFTDIFVLENLYLWIGGDLIDFTGIDGILVFSDDSGESWSKININHLEYNDFTSHFNSSGSIPSGIQQIYFSSLKNGLCLTGNTAATPFLEMTNIPLTTTDGGETWNSYIYGTQEMSSIPGRFAVLSDEKIISTGYMGEFKISSDQGVNWKYQNQKQRNFENFLVIKNGHLISIQTVLDTKGESTSTEYLCSNDFGKSWQNVSPQFFDKNGKEFSLENIYLNGNYLSPQKEVRILHGKSILHSKDYGQTWRLIHDDADFSFYHSLQFITPDTLIGYHVRMVETTVNNYIPELTFSFSTDCGRTEIKNSFQNLWNKIATSNLSSLIYSKDYFVNGQTGFIVGSEGNIIKTTNTGQSWESINSGVVDDLWDITFINRQTGFVVGDFGRILKTEDAGETWRKTNSSTQENVYSIGFENETEGWAGTETGLLYTSDSGENWQKVAMRYVHGKIREIEFDDDGNGYAYTYKLYPDDPDEILTGERPGGYILLLALKNGNVSVAGENGTAPKTFSLCQNYPNPFNSATRFHFYLPKSEAVSLKIYNVQGQLVQTIMDETLDAGEHEVAWDGISVTGQAVASGVYLCRLTGKGEVKTRKLLLLR